MPKNITVFTRPSCGPCRSLKVYLKSKGVNYNEVNVDEVPGAQSKVMELAGRMLVPMTLITKQDDSQEVVSGYNIGKIAAAIR